MKEVTLESAELAYLLATLGADSLLGVDNAALFPDSEAAKDRLYEQGLKLLREHEWITPDEEPGRENLNSELMVMVDAMTRALVVIVTERRDADESARHRMVHYLTDYMIVEQVYEEGQRYALAKVPELPAAMLRVVSTVGVPESSPIGAHRAESTEAAFAGITETVEAGELEEALAAVSEMGLDDETAPGLVEAIADPARRGTVTVMRLDGRRISDARAFAYLIREEACWLVTKPDVEAAAVEVHTATASDFWEVLAGYIDELMPKASAAS